MATVALKTITRVDRERNSKNGNPRYLVTFDDGTSARTAVDAAVAYGISNSCFQNPETSPISVTFDEKGDIIGVRAGDGVQAGNPM